MGNSVLASICCAFLLSLLPLGHAAAQENLDPSLDAAPAAEILTESNSDAMDPAASMVPTSDVQPSLSAFSPAGHWLRSDRFLALPNGVRVGPFRLTSLSSLGFFETVGGTNGTSQNLWGSLTTAELRMDKRVGKGQMSIGVQPQFSLTGTQPFVNANTGINFSYPLSQRLTLSASAAFSYTQANSLLQNPQYLLVYVNGGYAVQTLFAQTVGSATYGYTNLSASYQLSGRTQISINPQLGLTMQDQSGTLQFLHNTGFGISVSHAMTPNRSVSFSYNFTHSASSDSTLTSGASAWNGQSFSGSLQQKIGTTWYISGNLGASYQPVGSSQWTMIGGASIAKSFHNGSLAAAYSRTVATQILISNGYFDQVDLSYTRHIGLRTSVGFAAGGFRGVGTGNRQTGKRAGANFAYQWRRNLAVVASYNFTEQHSDTSLLYNGNISYISFGLNWFLGGSPAK